MFTLSADRTEASTADRSERVRVRWPAFAGIVTYATLVFFSVRHHEPWADEAQAWLLARDASLWKLWGTLLHYEGSPGLWHTILHALIAVGFPYYAYNYLTAALGIGAAWLIFRHSPFPLAIRLLLPFTFFLGYQYVVISRSYDLVPLLLFGCATIYLDVERRPWLFTLLLSLLAAVSVHGIILSACIVLTLVLTRGLNWRRLRAPAAMYLAMVALMVAAAYPAHDVTFVTQPGFSFDHWLQFSRDTLRDAFTGEGYSTIAVLALSIPFLWRGRGLLMFVSSALILCTFGSIVYAHVWHQGLIFLAWLFAIWISALRMPPSNTVLAALITVIGCHCYWTEKSVVYDWKNKYSAGKATAHFLRDAGIKRGHLYAVGYASTAVKPYFPAGTFAGGPAYWDWSVRNRMNDAPSLAASARREYVVVGYKSLLEQNLWSKLLAAMGYTKVRQLEGSLFWHDHVLEPESFDVFHQVSRGAAFEPASTVSMGDEKLASQLLTGFYGKEAGAWRWAAPAFSVVLKPPAGSERNGAILRLNFVLPDPHTGFLAHVALSADVDGVALESKTFLQGGTYVYSAKVPPAALTYDAVSVNFQLDTSMPRSGGEARELGAIVTAVGFYRLP